MKYAQNHSERNSDSFEEGFTLLEVLIALMLFSLITIAVFQSLLSMTSLSDRIQTSTEVAFDEIVDKILFERLVEGLFLERTDERRGDFTGSDDRFNGLSAGVIFSETNNQGIAFIKVAIVDGKVFLNIDGREVIISYEADAESLSYLGTDRIWRSNWPPKEALPFGPPDVVKTQDHELTVPPLLPLAVKLSFFDGTDWIAVPNGPARLSLTEDEL